MILGCNSRPGQGEISIVKEGEAAGSIFIPSDSIPGVDNDSLAQQIVIKVAGSRENMLGEYSRDNYGVFFKPIVDLTPGNSYQVLFKGRVISNFTTPVKTINKSVSLDAIYPSSDTLPENLLKIYLNFSQPMRQGVSEKYLTMLDGKGDTLPDIFLNLNTELWDEEGKQLTVWLDPGRIKRGLQPNEKEGNPLKTGSSYTLFISSQWADINGMKLDKGYSKKFITTLKDTQSPDPASWKMNVPASGSRQALSVSFNEPLDHSLLYNTVTIIRRDGEAVKGKIFVKNNERSLLFYPEHHWSAGAYYLKIDSRLEDLAGNNLNRLFDRDLLKDKAAGTDEFFTKQFTIN
jgi:hypothetical protein